AGPGGSGGLGGFGGGGGDALGGGIAVDAVAILTIVDSGVAGNLARGGSGGLGGNSGSDGAVGEGLGGGVYLGGTGSHRKNTKITGTFAPTGRNDVFGEFS